MPQHVILDECPPSLKIGIEAYWARKQQRLNQVLKRFPEDQRHLRMSIRRHPPQFFQARAVLTLPTATLVAEFDARDVYHAIDGVTDALVSELRRHKEQLHRHQHREPTRDFVSESPDDHGAPPPPQHPANPPERPF